MCLQKFPLQKLGETICLSTWLTTWLRKWQVSRLSLIEGLAFKSPCGPANCAACRIQLLHRRVLRIGIVHLEVHQRNQGPCCRIVGPTYSSAIGRLQCVAYQIFWHVWTSPFSLGFSFPFALGLGLLGQRWLRWAFCFAFVGIVRIRLGRWLGRCCCSQWQKMETHCWPHQSNRELFF